MQNSETIYRALAGQAREWGIYLNDTDGWEGVTPSKDPREKKYEYKGVVAYSEEEKGNGENDGEVIEVIGLNPDSPFAERSMVLSILLAHNTLNFGSCLIIAKWKGEKKLEGISCEDYSLKGTCVPQEDLERELQKVHYVSKMLLERAATGAGKIEREQLIQEIETFLQYTFANMKEGGQA